MLVEVRAEVEAREAGGLVPCSSVSWCCVREVSSVCIARVCVCYLQAWACLVAVGLPVCVCSSMCMCVCVCCVKLAGGSEGAAHDEVVLPVEAGEGEVLVVVVRLEAFVMWVDGKERGRA